MTNDVVDLESFREKKPDMVFECPCGSQHFYLFQDGTVQCRSCQKIMEYIEWIRR